MKDLTKGNIYKSFFLFALPLVLSGVFSQMYSIIDMAIAGKFIGESALAAIGAVSPLGTFLNAVYWGYTSGIGIYCGTLFGAKKYHRMKSVVINNVIALNVVYAVVSVLIFLFRFQIYSILKIDPAILNEADIYFSIITLGRVIILFGNVGLKITNAWGDSAFPFIMSVISGVLNVVGNLVSVTVLKLGMVGIAGSTVLSALVVMVLYLIKFSYNFKKLGLRKVKFNFKVLKETVKYSAPTTFQQSAMYFSSLAISPIVNSIGAAASASYVVSLKVFNLVASFYQNAALTVGAYTAQCTGAKKYTQLKKGVWVGFLQNTLYSLPIMLFCVFFPQIICGFFFKENASELAVHYSLIFSRIYLPFAMFNLVANLFHHFFRGIANMRVLVTATLAGSLSQIVVSIILTQHLGMHGFYIGWASSWVVDALIGAGVFFFGRWHERFNLQ